MSLRGKIFKKIAKHAENFQLALMELVDLPPGDQVWVTKKLEQWEIEFKKRNEELLERLKKKNL